MDVGLGSPRGYRDGGHRLPRLSLGLTSVRYIVNRLESEHTTQTGRELVRYDSSSIDDDYEFDSPLVESRGRVNRVLEGIFVLLDKCIPSVTYTNFSVLAVTSGIFAPKMLSYFLIYPFCRLVFGTLYPAYASYKAVRTKNLKEYVKWMMYWIVFALFTCTETVTDVFLSWFPFYYEVKIIIVLWLLSPATKGSSILYRKFVHPALCRREQEIDEYIAKAKDQGYHTVLNLGTKGVNYATTVIMQTAIKGGGGLVQQLKKSYSLSDLSECEPRERDEADDVLAEPQVIRRNVTRSGYNTRRSASESNTRSAIYFSEVDVDVRARAIKGEEPDYSHIKSTEDISSGYSSADNSVVSLARTGSVGAGSRVRVKQTRAAVTSIKRPQAAEGSEVVIEELQDDELIDYSNMPPLITSNDPSSLYLSHTDPPFIYQYVGDEIRIIQILKDLINKTDKLKEHPATSIQTNDEIDKNVTADIPSSDVITDIPSGEKDNKLSNDTTDELTKIKSTSEEIAQDGNDCGEDVLNNIESKVICDLSVNTNIHNDNTETISADISANDNDSAESDDEASFGTPDDSPKAKRKSPKGRYGKGKAPQPPHAKPTVKVTQSEQDEADDTNSQTDCENLSDIIKIIKDTNFIEKERSPVKSLSVNPISEKKMRHKSKSPKRVQKANASGIGKLLQLPSRLAFWQKKDAKNKDTASNSSGDSPRSSVIEQTEEKFDQYQSFIDLNVDNISTKSDDQISFKDASDYESESISHEIIEKSDELQKLIDAKIESHPEYNFKTVVEIPTTSKSTDV